jgi:hypothetical protein
MAVRGGLERIAEILRLIGGGFLPELRAIATTSRHPPQAILALLSWEKLWRSSSGDGTLHQMQTKPRP